MKKEREKIRKLLSSYIALAMVLTAVAGMITFTPPAAAIEEEPGIEVPTLRVYGEQNEGAGDLSVYDPITYSMVEDLPYTDAIAPFDPQHPQAPVKDSITFNPVYLSETLSDDELLGEILPSGPYDDRIKHSGEDAEEKVYLRQWYEPWHWDKDVDGDGLMTAGDEGDIEDFEMFINIFQFIRHLPPYMLQGKVPIDFTSPLFNFSEKLPLLDPYDEIYPAIMQEYTYLLIEPQYHQPTWGTPGNTYFVFPMGMYEEDIWDPYGYGLTSLDYDFDGDPDTTTIHSEKTLFAKTGIAADFDGGQSIDPIDPDGYELTGDEMVILSTEPAQISVGERWQFLDHMIEVVDTYRNPPSVKIAIWYTGDLEPEFMGYQNIRQYDMALFGRKLPATYIKAVQNGGGGTNLCDFPTGPWFVWAQSVHPDGDYAYLMIGRAVGHSHTAMENGTFEQDLTHRDPWWLKRFYVDGHEYNVVAIETYRTTIQNRWEISDSWDWTDTFWNYWFGIAPPIYVQPNGVPVPMAYINDLDSAFTDVQAEQNNNVMEGPPDWAIVDESGFKFITIRTPIPKSGERQNPVTHEIEYAYREANYSVQGEADETVRDWGYSHLIEQHSVRLQPYFINDYLSVLPPYNYEHTIAKDVQTNWSAMRNTPTEDPLFNEENWFCQPWDPPYNPDDGWDVPPQWIGDILTRRPPITQTPGDYIPYDNPTTQRVLTTEQMMYVEEDINPQYKGELKELYMCMEGDAMPADNGPHPDEWWWVEMWHTLPDMYTEFVLPEGNEHYLLTSAFMSEQSYGRILNQEKRGDDIDDVYWIPFGNRVKFWFNPMNIADQIAAGYITDASDLKIYKCEDGIRIYGFDSEGAGDYKALDPLTDMVPEIKPYTNPIDVFYPQGEQSPLKDSLTFNPAYMDQYHNGGEELADLYKWISIEESDAREKVFFRMWYEPWHWAKDVDADGDKLDVDVPDYDGDGYRESWELIWFLKHNPEYQDLLGWSIDWLKNPSMNPHELAILDPDDEIYPALMQEFTYMYVNVFDFPDHGQPGTSSIAFPIATEFDQLGFWDTVDQRFESDGGTGDFGWGLTTFDANFDDVEDICRIHSEYSLAKYTGIQWDTNGDGVIQFLDQVPGSGMNGSEIVIFAIENINVDKGDFVMFLDHMVRISDISADHVTFTGWRTGGSTSLNIFPSKIIGSFSLEPGSMEILKHGQFAKKLTKGQNNLASADGPWFVYVQALDQVDQEAVITIGRALGCTHTAMEAPGGGPDITPGDPWYMKRFYVDGHEYSTVAIHTHYDNASHKYKDEPEEFKFITMRTSIPKMPVIINQHSQRLQDYGVCMNISVMPPFNYEHTARRDIVAGWTECQWWKMPFFDDLFEWDEFMDAESDGYDDFEDFIDLDVMGEIIKNKPPLVIHINEEDREEQFKGELKEKYNKRPKVNLTGGSVTGYRIDPINGTALIDANTWGTLEGRSVSVRLHVEVTRTNSPSSGDGRVCGSWVMYDNSTDDSPPLFYDNSLFYGTTVMGDIRGWYDYSMDKLYIHLTQLYADAAVMDGMGFLEEWFLCFYAYFESTADILLNGTNLLRYAPWLVTQPPISFIGGWDPADQYPFEAGEDWEVWMVEQWHTLPDQYTELGLPDDGQLYLLTSEWYAPESIILEAWLEYPYGYAFDTEHEIGFDDYYGERVKFWYDPGDCEDIYVNTAWIGTAPPGEFWEQYDTSGNGCIEKAELTVAIQDYMPPNNLITKAQLTEVINKYFQCIL